MAAVLLLAAAKNGAVTAPTTASTSHAIDLGPATALQALTRVHATLKQLFGTSVSAPLHELDAALGHADLTGGVHVSALVPPTVSFTHTHTHTHRCTSLV